MSGDQALLAISLLVFAGAALAVYTTANALARGERIRRRFASAAFATAGAGPATDRDGGSPLRLLPARLGFDEPAQRRLRRDLIRAGFFDPGSVAAYLLARVALLLLLPVGGYLLATTAFAGSGATEKVALVGILFIVAYFLPASFLSRRERALQAKYRVTFPDYCDMLVVCINAGLSFEAALDRAARELGPEDSELRANLDLMMSETRAGRSTSEALRDFAERLGLPEARSFAGLLQQTMELGTDVALALTTFSDEMRDKRMARAEERAAALPPKLTLPLGVFIFPVVLIVVLAPAVLRILAALAS